MWQFRKGSGTPIRLKKKEMVPQSFRSIFLDSPFLDQKLRYGLPPLDDSTSERRTTVIVSGLQLSAILEQQTRYGRVPFKGCV